MPRVITIYLTDEEARDTERACEAMGVSRYSLVKLAIRDLCAASSSGALSSVHVNHKTNNPFGSDEAKRSSVSLLREFEERAKYVCAGCGFPLPTNVQELKSCPICKHTKYKIKEV